MKRIDRALAALFGLLVVVLAIGRLGILLRPVEAQNQRPGNSWACSLDNIAATLTQCQVAPEPGLRLYLTDVTAQSTTATGGQFLLQTGTGANCVTGTVSLLPSAASVVRFAAPGNAIAPTVMQFSSPLIAPPATAICALGVAVNTLTIQLSGYIAP